MARRRNIDTRDIDRLLSALSDVQIANVFGMAVGEVFELRQSRRTAGGQVASRLATAYRFDA